MKRDREGGGEEEILPHPLYILVLSSQHEPFICFLQLCDGLLIGEQKYPVFSTSKNTCTEG